jgi:hypothetical protein
VIHIDDRISRATEIPHDQVAQSIGAARDMLEITRVGV